jgi:predicted unusual protein kinase regulating ubiquinone biosynthesis (AarF/ABC1/UbiB family)
MAKGDESLRGELERRLLALGGELLPTSSLGRLGRTALAAWRGGRLAWRRRGGGEALPDVEALLALAASVGRLKGISMKAGQMLSYLDLPLPPELQAALSVLQTHAPAMPFERVAGIVEAELGERAGPLLARMEHAPAAAASIGQVHRAVLPGGVAVAVKVQYPGVEQAIQADFRSAAFGTAFVGLLAQGTSVDDVIREARRAVLEECDYLREAGCQERVAQVYQGHAVLTVPEVHLPWCARRVLTTTWAEGLRLDAFLATDPAQAERDRFGEALFEFYVGTLFRTGLYNWDPHPGNYLFRPDGRLTMLDHGSTREFDRGFVRQLAGLTGAVHADTREALHQAFLDLGLVRRAEPYDFDTARALVRSFFGPMLRDEVLPIEPGQARPLGAILASKRELLKLHIPPRLLFVFRIRFGLMSVLCRLGARANWYRLERRFSEGAG